MKRLGAILLAGGCLGMASPAIAHPGRLDATGCHTARRDYKYADGRELKAGERHCHGAAGSAAFLGMQWSKDTEPVIETEQRKEREPARREAP